MFQRPKIGETEEDLLRQEEEFLKKSGKSLSNRRAQEVAPNEGKKLKVSGIIGDIVEKNQFISNASNFDHLAPREKGFPALFQIDPSISSNSKTRKSLFALHVEKSKAPCVEKTSNAQMSPPRMSEDDCKMECEDDSRMSDESNNLLNEIHNENLYKLSKMSQNEIVKVQKKLYETLDPKLIELLKNRGKKRQSEITAKVSAPQDVEMKDVPNQNEEIKEKLANYVGEKWVNMDFVEKEKLEWVGEIPDSKALEPDKPYSARFDFNGELQPFTTETIDVTKSLHHHGEEPERPGYTIQELYQLSRSTVLQQRILAINTIANIIKKTKLGYYDVCFDGCLLHKLLDSDLFLLLRYSIDENSLIPAVINCLSKLLYNDTDEYCLDKLLTVTEDDVQPLLYDKMDANEEEEKELKDHTIINHDVIKGVLRTDLLVRITYILNNIKCDRKVISNAILCFIRMARHSIESCNQIANNSNLLEFVYSVIKCENPLFEGVKLFRVLIGQSEEFAKRVVAEYPTNFLIGFLDRTEMPEIAKSEFFLLKLECLHLWRNLLKHDLMIDDFKSWSSCFLRFLRFYTEKMEFYGEGDFDFELFSALMSILRLFVRKKFEIDNAFVTMLQICLEKWLKQLLRFKKFNYAGSKAIGSCFSFFVDYFEAFGIDETGLLYIKKFNLLTESLIESPVFDTMAENLIRYSHILAHEDVKRDPNNLQSLCSVYKEGYDFLSIVNNQSTFPFFVHFVKYLKYSHSVTHDSKTNIELFFRNEKIDKYIRKIIKVKRNSDNWFVRYELSLLTNCIQLFCVISDVKSIRLAFRLLPMMRIDDKNSKIVLSVITNSKNWSINADCFVSLYEMYLDNVYTPLQNCNYYLRYKNDVVGEDWMYKLLTSLRGKEAVAEVGKALKFINFILKTNPDLLERVPCDLRYYHLCSVFLTDENVFDEEINEGLKENFKCILSNRDKVLLDKKLSKNKSFYDLYTELITQYAGVSYGLHIFAEFVLFPLQNRFDISFRKLIWFEYLHVLRVITLPYPANDFLGVEEFAEPYETDESLLVAYLNSISNGIINRNRNPFVYNIAVGNVRNYLRLDGSNPKLTSFLKRKIETLKNEQVRLDLTT